jgi:hypothetical protein
MLKTQARSRWAAIGAACAVSISGGAFGVARAIQSTGERATYVPVTPVRVLDTRHDVGAVDILDAAPVLLTVTGEIPTTDGMKTVIPAGASGVVVNITAVNPSVNGFVSIRPGNATGEPKVSTLNVTAGGIFPNGATLTLPTSGGYAGQVQVWFEGYGTIGRTDMLIDVVGYYTDHNHDDRYYTEQELNDLLATKTSRTLVTDALGRTKELLTSPWTSLTFIDVDGQIFQVDNTGYATSISFTELYFSQASCQGDMYVQKGNQYRLGNRAIQLVAKALVNGAPTGTPTRISYGSQTIAGSNIRSVRSGINSYLCYDTPTGMPWNNSAPEPVQIVWGAAVSTSSFTPPFRLPDGFGLVGD